MRVKNNLASQKSKQCDTELIEYYRETRHILLIIIVTSLYSFYCILYYLYKGNNKITELRTFLQRESQNS